MDTLFGYTIPFPKSDLIIALLAVSLFLPIVVVVHNTAVAVSRLFTKAKTP